MPFTPRYHQRFNVGLSHFVVCEICGELPSAAFSASGGVPFALCGRGSMMCPSVSNTHVILLFGNLVCLWRNNRYLDLRIVGSVRWGVKIACRVSLVYGPSVHPSRQTPVGGKCLFSITSTGISIPYDSHTETAPFPDASRHFQFHSLVVLTTRQPTIYLSYNSSYQQ
jgi:hypothetical protein